MLQGTELDSQQAVGPEGEDSTGSCSFCAQDSSCWTIGSLLFLLGPLHVLLPQQSRQWATKWAVRQDLAASWQPPLLNLLNSTGSKMLPGGAHVYSNSRRTASCLKSQPGSISSCWLRVASRENLDGMLLNVLNRTRWLLGGFTMLPAIL